MRNPKLRAALTGVLPVILLLVLAGAASAEWNVTNIVDAWDDATLRYESGNAQMYLDGSWESMHHDFFNSSGNQNEFDTAGYPNACPGGVTSRFAGEAEFALDHTDDAPMGAPGFQSTRNWALVRCDALQVGVPQDPDKKYAEPADIIFSCTPDNNDGDIDTCEIVSQDVVDATRCTGNCYDEIITKVRVNLDMNCDGVLDAEFQNVGACLYWEAEKPSAQATPMWNGNMQVHVDQAGGRKTVNFAQPEIPLAVSLRTFTAAPAAGGVSPLAVASTGVVIALASLVIARRSGRGR